MTVASQLWELEKLDGEIERQASALAERRSNLLENRDAVEADARSSDARQEESGAASRLRTLESELSDLEAKIKRDQSRLYGGQVVDPRELSSLERELERHKAERGSLEDRLLQAMEQQEALNRKAGAAASFSVEAATRAAHEKPHLLQQLDEAAQALEELESKRVTLDAALDDSMREMYGRLRKTSMHAVSLVKGGVCQWCRVTIPPKDIQHARSGTFVTCGNCSRILYVP